MLGKALWYPLNTRLAGPQSHSRHNEEENVFLPLLDSNSGRSTSSLISVFACSNAHIVHELGGQTTKVEHWWNDEKENRNLFHSQCH
jgi:hypothetical protein